MTLSTTEITNTVTVTEDPDSITIVADNFTQTGGGGGSGTVTSVSVTTANGVSGTVATATSTPAITISLGAITPTTVNGLTLTTSTGTVTITNLKTFAVTNTLTLSGTDGSTLNIGSGGTLGTAAFTAATAYLAVSNNLSDLASAATARTNLGLGTLATQSGTFSGTSSGTNTGDQTSIVGITGTFAEFNTAVTDADLARTSGTNTFTGDQTSTAFFVGRGGIVVGNAGVTDGQIQILNETNSFSVTITAANTTVGDQSWIIPDTAGDAAVFVARDLTQTLTNKRITQRVASTTSSATAAIDCDTTDVYELTAVAATTTFSVTGTPTNGQSLVIRFKDNGSSQSLSWNAVFAVIGVTLPTSTTSGKWHYVGVKYNSNSTKWDVLAVSVQA